MRKIVYWPVFAMFGVPCCAVGVTLALLSIVLRILAEEIYVVSNWILEIRWKFHKWAFPEQHAIPITIVTVTREMLERENGNENCL